LLDLKIFLEGLGASNATDLAVVLGQVLDNADNGLLSLLLNSRCELKRELKSFQKANKHVHGWPESQERQKMTLVSAFEPSLC
jgi:hypothetical protein